MVVNPVTHTDEVAVNKASIKLIPPIVTLGSINKPVPVKMTNAKLKIKSREGFTLC